MKVLLNLVSLEQALERKVVVDWVLQYVEQHQNNKCVIISTTELPIKSFNTELVVVNPPQNRSAFLVWKRLTLEPMIRKQASDLVITWELLRTAVSSNQVLIASPIKPGILENTSEKRKPTIKNLEKVRSQCKHLIVFSELEKEWIASRYPQLQGRVRVIHRIPSLAGKPSGTCGRESVKEKYTDGNEFFIAPSGIDIETLTVLLKGFSGFKKWQKSNMELILSYGSDEESALIRKLLELYRFKGAVQLVSKKEDDYSGILSSAYAAILPDKVSSNLDFLFAALRWKVPVISPENSVYAEVAADACLYYSSNKKEEITRALLHIFKEELFRSQLANKGSAVIDKFATYDSSEELFK